MKKPIQIFHQIKTKIKNINFLVIILILILPLTIFLIVNQQQKKQKPSGANAPATLGKIDESIQPFVNNPQRGLYWAGLRSGRGGSLCGKLLEVVDKAGKVTGCTHGPDPAPQGLNAAKSVEPLTTGDGGTLTTAATLPCDGDGASGYRVQAIYVRASDKPDRYSLFATSFAQYAQVIDTIFSQSAAQTGGVRHVRFVTDSSCNIAISRAIVSPTGDDTFGNMVTELKNQGYNRTDRKYLLWADATVYCGLGTIYLDDGPTQSNWNNTGPLFGRTDSGCWGGGAEAHELTHNLGGVQLSAPHNTSGSMHCTDEYDLMCYKDSTSVTMTYPCASTSYDNYFDCGKNDYFSTNPLAGSYLTTHWNTANNRFLIGAVTSSPTPTSTPSPTPSPAPSLTSSPTPSPKIIDTTVPTVSISSPTNGTTIGTRVTIAGTARDNVGVVSMQVYIDGNLRTSSTTSSISTNWNSRKASIGTHTITVKAKDAAGNIGSAVVAVYK